MLWRLQGFDPADFVSRYWQKRPCVLRGALAGFESPVTPEELAGLACEDGVHCRLVLERGGAHPWELRYGPFTPEDFAALPDSHYSLLVSECEQWLPELGPLLDRFRFIPDWRIDDLMLSYAPAGGSVGAHVDAYDVFLLQAMGKRRWLYTDAPVASPSLVAGLELALLEDFAPDREAVLEPGDLLYLPPGIAHHGIALEPCMTYSIGFRAPTASSVLESLAFETEQLGERVRRYADPDLELDRDPAEITAREIERFRALAVDLLGQAESLWPDAIGKMLTDSSADGAGEEPVYVSDLLAGAWGRHPATRLLFHRGADDIRFYYNGRVHALPADDALLPHIRQMCARREWPQELIAGALEHQPLERLMLELAANGAIIPIEE